MVLFYLVLNTLTNIYVYLVCSYTLVIIKREAFLIVMWIKLYSIPKTHTFLFIAGHHPSIHIHIPPLGAPLGLWYHVHTASNVMNYYSKCRYYFVMLCYVSLCFEYGRDLCSSYWPGTVVVIGSYKQIFWTISGLFP